MTNILTKEIYQKCLEHYNQPLPKISNWNDVAKSVNFSSGEVLRSAFRREYKKNSGVNTIGEEKEKHEGENTSFSSYKESEEIKEDGTIISDRLIEICEQDSKKPESLLKAHGFSTDFILVSAKQNLFHSQKKGGSRLLCYQSKITVRPKKESDLSIQAIEDFFANYSITHKDTEYKARKKTINNGYVLEIAVADLHIGSRNVAKNEENIIDRFHRAIDEIIEKTENKSISEILFLGLGDLCHFDNTNRTTSHGTRVETNGMSMKEMFDTTLDLLITAINKLEKIAPVEVVGILGNHDKTISYIIYKSLSFYYMNNKNVIVDFEDSPCKFRRYGNCLIGFTHGSMPKKNQSNWLSVLAKKYYNAEHKEIHQAHLHSLSIVESGGLVVRGLSTIASTDEWHLGQGYVGAEKRIQSFLWDKNKGLSEVWNTGC